MEKNFKLSLLRMVALGMVIAGAGGSLVLVLRTGRNNNSVLLISLFVIWVLSPFVALVVAHVISKRWTFISRVTLYSLMIVVTLGSLVSYSGALSPRGTKPAFVFLVVPLLSWILLAVVIWTAKLLSRRSS